jgi:photosystem II stability/assembly factor-like uncharacterized protein
MVEASFRSPSAHLFSLFGALVAILLVGFIAAGASSGAAAPSWYSLGPDGGPVASLAIDPANGDLVYVGGEGALFFSTDGGQLWAPTGAGLEAAAVLALVVDPLTSTTLWAGTDVAGVLVSVDSGATFGPTGLASVGVTALVRDPLDADTLWAGTENGGMTSVDGGINWTPMTNGLPTDALLTLALAVDSALYAGNDQGEVYRSTDSGSSWTPRSTNLPGSPIVGLVADSVTASTLYVATEDDGVWKSTDSGGTWTLANSGITAPALTSVDQDSMTPSTLYASSEGLGLFRSDDGAAGWSLVAGGLTALQLTDVAVDPSSSINVLAGSEDAGVFRSTDGGINWTEANSGLTLTDVGSVTEGAPPGAGAPSPLYSRRAWLRGAALARRRNDLGDH